jgi:hypothetical protein
VTIFLLAQRRAITSGKEDITKAIINSTVKDCQYFVSRIFDSLREGQNLSHRKGLPLSDMDSSEWRQASATSPRDGLSKKNVVASLVGNSRVKAEAPLKNRSKTKKKKADQYAQFDLRRLIESASVNEPQSSNTLSNALADADEFE